MNRITDLNNSASFSANKTATNFISGGLNNTSKDPFRSVDALGHKRRQLSKTHCELQKHLNHQNETSTFQVTLERSEEEEDNKDTEIEFLDSTQK